MLNRDTLDICVYSVCIVYIVFESPNIGHGMKINLTNIMDFQMATNVTVCQQIDASMDFIWSVLLE